MDAQVAVTTPARRRRWWVAAAAIVAAVAALVRVQVVAPRVHVRWQPQVTAEQRRQLERRFHLDAAQRVEGETWRYDIEDRSSENVGALLDNPAVADTAYIDRDARTVPRRRVQISSRLGMLAGPAPGSLVQPQSLVLLAVAVVLLWGSRAPDPRRRRALAMSAIAVLVLAAYAVPLRQPIRMGDSNTYMHDRESFELFSGVKQIRFEAHLSHAILGRLDALFGRTAVSPARALHALAAGATAWFALGLLIVGWREQWSAAALRYLGLVAIAPSALLYFGYLEIGQLSLMPAVFPLLARGLERRTSDVEAGATLAGLAAALHGFGLVSLVGGACAALAAPYRWRARLALAARVIAWGTAAYLGWVAIYLIVLKLPLVPGHAGVIPFRPWFVSEAGDRLNAALFSRLGLRDLSVEAWLVGAPLLVVAAGLRRAHPVMARLALAYTIPSLLFLIVLWPVQGVAVEMDLVFAAFPAAYALAWLCARDERRSIIAAVLLASAHLLFWRVVLDTAFVNSRLG